ncbi:3537_t:CDS:10 [Ambispora gerdemannii]|uniref:asparaginase n=1 Tax=Ambispora gerdemannii TaxID=144530 RepID=A0A9N9AW25_9GLOM|nr:3537_t:CDS:10 [Ambispora gerdemannii]
MTFAYIYHVFEGKSKQLLITPSLKTPTYIMNAHSLKRKLDEVESPEVALRLSPECTSDEELSFSRNLYTIHNDSVLEALAANRNEMATSNFSRVLILYTGGTIGMKQNKTYGYVPVPNYLTETLSQMSRFYDPRGLSKITASSFDTPHIFDQSADRDVFMNKVVIEGKVESIRGLITPPSLYGKRISYSIYEYVPLLDSCNMTMKDWIRIASDVEANYQIYDAFIILHGTDTMAYTASALSFILENLGKTVILTGSQVPISEVRNDAVENLLGALTIAGHFVIPEVCLFFNNKLFRGNRVSKMNAVDFDAFDSPNLRPLVKVGINIEVNWSEIVRPSHIAKFKTHKKLNSNVATLRLFPGITESTVRAFLAPPIEGIVLETYGAGNAPDTREDLMKAFTEASERGVIIVNCSQCKKGLVTDLYATGKALNKAGVVPGSDMTAECALAKLSYLLGQNLSANQVRQEMTRNLRGELTVVSSKPRFTFNRSHTLIRKIITAAANSKTNASSGLSINLQERVLMEKSLYPILLCSAAGTNDLVGMEELWENVGESLILNCVDYDERTPMHIACTSGHYKIAKFLVERGASVHVRDRFGHTPLFEAARNKHRAIIELLRLAGAHFNDSESDHVIFQAFLAASTGDVELLKNFVDAGWEVNRSGFDHRTALHHAVAQGHRAVVAYLLSLPGILPDTKDRWTKTPLDDAELNLGRMWGRDDQREADARDIVSMLRLKIEERQRAIAQLNTSTALPNEVESDQGRNSGQNRIRIRSSIPTTPNSFNNDDDDNCSNNYSISNRRESLSVTLIKKGFENADAEISIDNKNGTLSTTVSHSS